MTHAITFVLCVLGFAAMAGGMARHQNDVVGRTLDLRTTRWVRTVGWLLLLSALVVVAAGQGWALGLVSYSGHTSVGAGIVFIALAAHGRLRLERGKKTLPRSDR